MLNSEKVQQKLGEFGLDAIIITSVQNCRYVTSFDCKNETVIITPSDVYFLTDARFYEDACANVFGAEIVLCGRGHEMTLKIQEILAAHNAKNVGIEEAKITYARYLEYERVLGVRLVAAQHILSELRRKKELYEIRYIIEAQRIAERALDDVMGSIHAGITERQVAAELEFAMRKYGGGGNAFMTVAFSGRKTSMPHGAPGDKVLQNGDFLIMDFGCVVNGYSSDMTRTFAIGNVTDEMRRVYDTVLASQEAGIAVAKAGVTGAEIHNAGAKVIADAGYGEYFNDIFGHGVGLEMFEAPNASPDDHMPMPVNTVITAEPGIYIPGKFGVRIEDMICITPDGCDNLTEFTKELIVLK